MVGPSVQAGSALIITLPALALILTRAFSRRIMIASSQKMIRGRPGPPSHVFASPLLIAPGRPRTRPVFPCSALQQGILRSAPLAWVRLLGPVSVSARLPFSCEDLCGGPWLLPYSTAVLASRIVIGLSTVTLALVKTSFSQVAPKWSSMFPAPTSISGPSRVFTVTPSSTV